MPRRVSCPRLIGRERELADLVHLLERAAAGEPATTFVLGEAGIGKSRLVGELAGYARGEGFRVLTGRCIPVAEGLLPYSPIVEILRGVLLDLGADGLRALAGPAADLLGVLLPALLEPGTSPTRGPRAEDQPALHAALFGVVEQLARDRTVIVVEDLHWADPSTRDLLRVLVRGLDRGHLLLVGTCRDDEMPPTHPTRELLAELGRSASVLSLRRLVREQTAAQVAGIRRTDTDLAAADSIFARSGGNPFLVEELLAADEAGEILPDALRDILLLRPRQLPPVAARVLRCVAGAGGSADHALLEAVAGLPPDELLTGVRLAVDGHVLVPDGERYTFRHALTAEAVGLDTLPGERIELHRALARALSARLPQWTIVGPVESAAALAEVAFHWSAGQDPARTLVATVTAGLAAQRGFALREARLHYERAIELWAAAPDARDEAALDLIELFIRAADCAVLTGDFDGAIALLRRGIADADAAADPTRVGLMHALLGKCLVSGLATGHDAIAAMEVAVRLVPDRPSAARAGVLGGFATVLLLAGRQDEARRWARRGLKVARQVGARAEESDALTTIGLDLVLVGDVERGLPYLRESLAIADEVATTGELFRAYLRLADGLAAAGRFAESVEVAALGAERARQRGTDGSFGDLLQGAALEYSFWLGRWDEIAEAVPEEPLAVGNPIACFAMWLDAALVHTARGDFARARHFLDECLRAIAVAGAGEPLGVLHATLAELSLWSGDPEAARDWVAKALGNLPASGHAPLLARLLAAGARAEADLAPTRRASPSTATELAELVAARTRLDPPPLGAALLALARCELARARRAEGTVEVDPAGWSETGGWGEVASIWQRMRCPYQLGYARWRQAEALLATRGARRSAALALTQAHSIAVDLGAVPLRSGVERLARRARLELSGVTDVNRPAVTDPPGRGPGRGSDDAGRGVRSGGMAGPEVYAALRLTRREEEVLRLIADGCTNRQIARALFISEKTVSIHVSRVLAKLGVPNRSAAAGTAHQLGLVDLPRG
jgi:DNA-binding CsgD family transcriptional regulator/tetratricopeptide (TPR) repeat protein